jgi:tetratricopeptide (TPR) repeat protein
MWRGHSCPREKAPAFWLGLCLDKKPTTISQCVTANESPPAIPPLSDPLNNLTVAYGRFLGQFEKAIATGQQALRLNPHQTGVYAAMASAYLALNRVDEARSISEAGLAANPDDPGPHWSLYVVGFVEGDETLMQRVFDWGVHRRAGENWVLHQAAGPPCNGGSCRKPET